jgi:hypothetical protein
VAGKIASLERELEDYFFRFFTKRQELLSSACPGEEECCREGRIFERREYEGPELPILRVCHGSEEFGEPECEALETKPSNHPPHLTQAIAAAYELTEIDRATYAWPDALEPVEWACMRAYQRAEKRLKRKLDDEQAEKQRAAEIMNELERKRRR